MLLSTRTMYADQYTNYNMNFGSDKVSDSVVNIRLGQFRACILLSLSNIVLDTLL